MTLTHADAERIARELALARGWMWREPVRVSPRRRFVLFGRVTSFEVWSNADRRGANVVVVIDGGSGEVLRSAYLPR
ncbi:MAG: hypothetical protein JST00_45855 [Deltaproteobacteria bacterium]|nr:hypothetical protein [Deltaproteobacteria bacterium]